MSVGRGGRIIPPLLPLAKFPKNAPCPLNKGMNSPTNFECRVTDEEVLISFDATTIRLPLPEAESLHHLLAYHVYEGEGGFRLGGVEIDMEDAFILCEVLKVAFEEGYGVAFGDEDEEE